MKKIIIVCTIFLATSVAQAQEYSAEYKVVCRRAVGCPVINGTCPTCVIIGKEGTVKKSRETIHREIDEWGEKMKKSLIIDYSKYYKSDVQQHKGWGWDGPTWRGLWVGERNY